MKKFLNIVYWIVMIGVSLPILIFLVFMGVISYCNYSNEIDFDIKSATITHKEGKYLYRLYLEDDSLGDSYHIKLKEGHEAAKKISLTSVDTNYIITNWRKEQFSKITLHPNRMYRIENHSNGDCGPGTVAFMTDSLGKPACIMPYE